MLNLKYDISLPSIEKQDEIISYIYSEKLNIDKLDEAELYCIRNYGRWYARRVIQHCAEVAKIKEVLLPTKEQYEYSKQFIVDKQSILNVINQL